MHLKFGVMMEWERGEKLKSLGFLDYLQLEVTLIDYMYLSLQCKVV